MIAETAHSRNDINSDAVAVHAVQHLYQSCRRIIKHILMTIYTLLLFAFILCRNDNFVTSRPTF